MALQSYIGCTEYRAMLRQKRSQGQDIGGRTPIQIVMRSGWSYWIVMAVELAIAAVAVWALTR